jgi:hypothetical protein
MNLVVSPTPMLKLCQLMKAPLEALIVNCGPLLLNETEPRLAVPPCGLAQVFGSAKTKPKTRPQIMSLKFFMLSTSVSLLSHVLFHGLSFRIVL